MFDKEYHSTANLNIPNLHPSHGGPSSSSSIVSDFEGNEQELSCSFKDRIESFVGSYSRASMMHMAENVIVSDAGGMASEDENEVSSIFSSSFLPRYSNHNHESTSRRNSEGTLHERTSLLYPSLQKINSCTSVVTVADSYSLHQQPHTISKSSFLQSIFNSINILIGVGILALPLGFKNAGWVMGLLVFLFCFGLTNYTAKLLVKCLDADPNSYTYGDMGAYAYGVKGRVFISVLFLTELTTCSVALVVLLSDGIESLFPGHDPVLVRVISFLILTPTLFIPVRHLSYTSLLGILSVFSLMTVIIYDGLSKPTTPGSLHEMAVTSIFPEDWLAVPMSFGLIMAGFAGHAVFPTIYRDMKRPKDFDKMVNYTYIVTALVYLTVAVAGYIMFGSDTMQEITLNLVTIPEYNQMLTRLAVWLIALNPVAKYGLTLNPIILSWQIGLLQNSRFEAWLNKKSRRTGNVSQWKKPVVKVIGVVSTSAFIVVLSFLLPNFDQVMSLLGALFSFIISGIFPLMCYLKLFKHSLSRWQILLNYVLVIIAVIMALAGTVRAFI
ncbi:MAG: transmembrane amino acid transporter protein-domain-containing protein [Benjaminiella poitrasii]|nr:MAG: transmembrane amino acid transporter protein-domain-containing protein [Benjaminiella poitrasii]